MSTATARVASEGVDYLAVIKGYFKKNKSNGRPKDSNLVVVKILGLEFRHQWGSQLRAEYKTALGKIEPFTIYNLESDSLKLDGFVDNSEVNDSASIVRFVKEEIAALEAKVAANARVIAKRHTLKFGEVVIPIKPVTGLDHGDWRFTYNGEFKLGITGTKSTAYIGYLSARKAGMSKRVTAYLKGKVAINSLQQKLDELIEANKLVMAAPASAKTSGTVKIGDEVINVSVISMKLFKRHIANLEELYGKKERK
jgi:hypothetical protein